MNSNFKQSFDGFGSQTTGGERSTENRRKKRTKLCHGGGGAGDPGSSISLKHKPVLKKPETGAPKITRPCSECGKQFWSWKALFGHMRCHPERQWRGINPPPNYRRPVSPENRIEEAAGAKLTEEEHEVASCLVMLANWPNEPTAMEEEERYECLSCKRVFDSHQALGGHRASHKNVKGCFAIARSAGEDGEEQRSCDHSNHDRGDQGLGLMEVKEGREEKTVVVSGHRCSVCLRVFSSGQALGGHMRCHLERGDEPSPNGLNPSTSGVLDLNFPAPEEETDDSHSSSASSSSPSPPDLILDLRLGM
ncbi:PREDICTED: zinc finger protein ZAT3-like [Nelumbo nucifera]|uniref:Zinc finger protein ZAT3-like n=1 Tax=Nelumbo nucifera TaxID=4432 RepID=A0A1U7Z7E8_NELNU|nr:PREDICTED: zinc finger protein ZAT3-like [Nelumbo nucifera]